MPTTTVEDYIKQIFLEEQREKKPYVSMGKIAQALHVVPGTVTTMVKSLAELELVEYQPRKGVTLTDKGRQLALSMLRRHRIIEVFLVQTLGLDWSEVHVEAERLEHALSDKVLEKLDAFLGRPTTDPHGAPIPSSNGEYNTTPLKDLTECGLETSLKIMRIESPNTEFLQYLESQHLTPGQSIQLTDRSLIADSVTLLLPQGNRITLGLTAGKRIFVQ